ncbi:DUF5686 and carboxypeptidase regulatory-like domain-containing protein [Reichenbachiella carrageenanivorans]|uniref:DUF5686 and carboxypeptidase regulatory-like domain-containing protein n=1 Tax=Reichenbachiella carrageenanivorans TaxID=2979869 RepID=A0ABY6D159_9BACT|nr:DUF5686 and carboxypeptidase regulatory-like domain-containing protein [Reichenbachiella carrageenanivorans]UXX78813.1 DUF5686 and carboxypeptidase regulatory-like domain-containing protein [Reichenbachiella carrageenanivorans]
MAAELFGTVTDQSGVPLPFATLYVLNTTKGTTTNIEGRYSLDLPPGQYELVYQYVGYKKQQIPLKVDHRRILLNVVLEPEVLQLEEVVVKAGGPDPAYAVIREAMAKRKYHQEEVNAYKCKVYVKGMQTLDEKPDQVLGVNIALDTGIVYLSESVSELSIARPDKIKEVMISSKVSGSNSAFSYNQGSQMLISFYDNLMTFPGLSERGFVSPIAQNALLFYDYKLEGTMMEGGLLVNKIRVIPKRKNDPAFEGFIYIIEDAWRIYSVDLKLTKAHQIEFLDEVNVYQVYAPVQDGIWMLFSQRFTYYLNVFGFRGNGNFVGIHSEYEIEPNYELVETKKADQIQLFPNGYFDNEILKIENKANKRDAKYWEEVRPIPLTKVEKIDYWWKDSLQHMMEAKPYKDSIDKVSNKFNFQNLFIGGYVYQQSYKERYFRFQPIYDILQYNTVEGAVVNLKASYVQEKERIWKYQVTPTLRYGFSSEDFYYKAQFSYQFNPIKRTRAYVEGGQFVSQYNASDPISPLINSFETLVNRRNYMKLYEKSFAKLHYSSEVVNGVTWKSTLEYAHRTELQNTADYSFFYQDDRLFAPNAPSNDELNKEGKNTSFGHSRALVFTTNFYIKFGQKYISRPDMKFNLDSKYPTIFVQYRKAIPVTNSYSDANFDEVVMRVYQGANYGLFGSGNYTVWAGTFFNTDKMDFMDYRHFTGNQSIFAKFGQDHYQLLDYYQYSTNGAWLGVHVDHHFNGFILNKFPLIRKTKAQVVASVNYLHTSVSGHYIEYGVGLEHLFKVLRLDFYGAMQDGSSYGYGLRAGLGF